ncbi:aminotransferase class V-fold PLP-dependent enzyme [bacterium]|nr:aminotransferase class V-fold PLP-dependent enzyme [bacterium]
MSSLEGLDIAAEFPITRNSIYLSHSAISPLPARTAAAIQRYAKEASEQGLVALPRWIARLGMARSEAAMMLRADEAEIGFVKSTTHGLMIVANSLHWLKGQTIIVEEHTFPANWYVWKGLEERAGVQVVTWPERNFRYEMEDLARLLSEHDVAMVSLTAASYSTGFRHDLAAIGKLLRESGVLFCVDAIQQLGAFPIDANECCIDFLAADSHKWLLGPEGAGIVYVNAHRLDMFNDTFVGWLGREGFEDYDARDLPPDPTARRFEEGAPNQVGVQGMGASLTILNEVGIDVVAQRIRANCRVLQDGLRDLRWKLISPADEEHASGIVAFEHAEKDPSAIVRALAEKKIVCSARRGFLRMAPHFYQTPEEMQRVVDAVRETG